MFFDNWYGLIRILVLAPLIYVSLVTVLRLSGKRTLSTMNAYDMVVTVAVGSAVATILLSSDVALLEGVFAIVMLIALQYVISWISTRSVQFSKFVKGEPSLLVYKGVLLSDQMRTCRIVEAEIATAVRQAGLDSISTVGAVVLETDGKMAVIGDNVSDLPNRIRDQAS